MDFHTETRNQFEMVHILELVTYSSLYARQFYPIENLGIFV